MRKLLIASGTIAMLFIRCANPGEEGNTDSVLTNADTVTPSHAVTMTSPVDTVQQPARYSILEGTYVEKYDNGIVYMRGNVRGGIRHGQWLTFYSDGKPWSEGTYINGKREGYGVAWYQNGNKHEEGYYKNGRKVGKWKYWNETGELTEHDFAGDTANIRK
jgi:hypothetical protein